MAAPRVLISTISARTGGVPAMVRAATRVLRGLGAEPVIAYYEPYSMNPALSVPAFALGQRRPGVIPAPTFDGCETHAIGAWLPELEFTTYRLNEHWRRVIDSTEAHIAVSGNVLAALPLAMSGRPYLAWIASDWHGDRVDRVRRFNAARRVLDALVVRPVMTRTERRLLRGGDIVALSQYTARRLAEAGGIEAPVVCPTAVDTECFRPDAGAVTPGHLVFSGRVDDPRKNLALLLEALARLVDRGREYRLSIAGGRLSPMLDAELARLGLRDRVTVLPYLDHGELSRLLAGADVFVVPSYQEGLCIAALEAMACGTPVVSTRCGGPEDYVVPDVNGELVDFDAAQMAAAIDRIVADRVLRARYAAQARAAIEQGFAAAITDAALREAIVRRFPALADDPGGIRFPKVA